MTTPYFFGYGSLVNRATHIYRDSYPAQLTGWRRAWVGSPARGVVLLTGVPANGHQIDGLIAAVPGADWAALDAREQGYARISTQGAVCHDAPHAPEIAVYAVQDSDMVRGGGGAILLSYLDVVVQGFLQVFGEDGVQRFFDTTDGWDTPILDDRANPIYPRHQILSPAERALVDGHLERLSAQVQQGEQATLTPEF